MTLRSPSMSPFRPESVAWRFSLCLCTLAVAGAAQIPWAHQTSRGAAAEVPSPTGSNQQTACVVGDFDGDGRGDFVIASRGTKGRIEFWHSRPGDRFDRYTIEASNVNPEAGGAAHDIDGDGDLDLVLGQDSQGTQIFWWENPAPNFSQPWQRRLVSTSTATKHHDQIFADVDIDGVVELVSWNQGSKSLLLFELPKDPRGTTAPWQSRVIGLAASVTKEGLAFADVDLDGRLDLVAGGSIWRYSNGSFTPTAIDSSADFTRVAVGQLVQGGRPEIVLAPGDVDGKAYWYQWNGSSYTRNYLADVRHAHTIEIADLDGNGKQDIVVGEMRLGHPQCELAVYRGNGQGSFTKQVLSVGNDIHEGQLVDLDGDGDLDLVHKPYDYLAPRVDIWRNGSKTLPVDRWTRSAVDGPFATQAVYSLPGDLDGDGWADIVAGDSWWRHPGTSSAGWKRTTFAAPLRNVAAIADFDGDGDLDVFGTQGVGANANANFAWGENDGRGRFTIHTNIDSGKGDFLQGVVVDRFHGSSGPLSVALSWHVAGAGVQMLTVPASPATVRWTWTKISNISQDEDLAAGDIDQDGDLDLLLGTTWLENPSWTPRTIGRVDDFQGIGGTPTPDRNALADMDGDGDLDAVVALEFGNEIVWFENPRPAGNVYASWTRRVLGWSQGQGFSMSVGDVDRDGDPDVLLGEHRGTAENRVVLFVNDDPYKNFRPVVIDKGPITSIDHHDGTVLFDMDEDDDLDIVSVGWTNPRLWLYTNDANKPGQNGKRAPLPILDPANAIFQTRRSVHISAPAGTTIRYTLDSSSVTDKSPVYSGPIDLTSTTTLRTRTFQSGVSPSFEVSGSFARIDDELSWYSFDAFSGATVYDHGSAGKNASSAGMSRVAGWNGIGGGFNGTSSHVVIPTPTLSQAVTVSAWINAESFDHLAARDARILSQAIGVGEQDHGLMLSTIANNGNVVPRFRLRVNNWTTTLIGSVLIPTHAWVHVSAVYDGATMRLYVDGNLAGSMSRSGAITLLPNGATWIGDNPVSTARAFDGVIDNVKIWDRALSEDELRALGRNSRRDYAFQFGYSSAICGHRPRIELDDDLHASTAATAFGVLVTRCKPWSPGVLYVSGSGVATGFDFLGAKIFGDPFTSFLFPIVADANGVADTKMLVSGIPAGTRFVWQALVAEATSCWPKTLLLGATPAIGGFVLPPR
ncbi:MAG: VCBS repeat-containing protein [Planctomycetes bacterium]|nr:VCBS repeat-containing protein [Planctomycetota bacterium]MCB9918551.1 VCBS repeat-containing protein [Planctomycetota bacterium]